MTRVTKKSKNQNKEKKRSGKPNPIYDKMMKENEEIKRLIETFKTEGSNTSKLEQKIDATYKELESLRRENQGLNEKVWKAESDLNVRSIDLENKLAENGKLSADVEQLRVEVVELKDAVENWKEKYQAEKQKNIFLEQQNRALEDANRKLEKALNEALQKMSAGDEKILQVSKENSALATAKQMLEDKIRRMEKEIERMNNMVSMTQSQMAPNAEHRSNFLGSEHNFGINTTFGKDPRQVESKMIQGLNSQLAELRNEREEIKGKLNREQREHKEQLSNLGRLTQRSCSCG